MSNQDDTRAQLEAAREDLTTRINTLAPGASRDALVQRRDQIHDQINVLLGKAFNDAAAGLGAAIANLAQCTTNLKSIGNAMSTLAQVIQVADTVVQAAATIIGLAVG